MLGTDAARPRALDRPRLDEAVAVDVQEALGRRADHAGVGRLEKRGKRRRVAPAEPRVEVPRRLAQRRLEPLRQVGLEDVAREDVVAHALHGVEVVAARERRAQLERGIPPAVLDRGATVRRCEGAKVATGARVRGCGVLPAARRTSSRARSGPSRRGRVRCLGHAGRDQPRARGDVIPREHPVVDAQHDIGQREIVVARRGQTLERQPPVVGDVAGGATLKRRQPGDRFGAERRQPRAYLVERAARSLALDHVDRIGGQKRIAAEPCRRGRAVEKEAIRQTRELLAARTPDPAPASALRRAASRVLQSPARSSPDAGSAARPLRPLRERHVLAHRSRPAA